MLLKIKLAFTVFLVSSHVFGGDFKPLSLRVIDHKETPHISGASLSKDCQKLLGISHSSVIFGDYESGTQLFRPSFRTLSCATLASISPNNQLLAIAYNSERNYCSKQ